MEERIGYYPLKEAMYFWEILIKPVSHVYSIMLHVNQKG